jgi:hypothetical protein
MANAAGADLDQNLARAGLGHLNIFECEWDAGFVKDRCFHEIFDGKSVIRTFSPRPRVGEGQVIRQTNGFPLESPPWVPASAGTITEREWRLATRRSENRHADG